MPDTPREPALRTGNSGRVRSLSPWPLPSRLEAVLGALLPALFAGFHLAGLVFFLNPLLPVEFSGYLAATLRLALLLAPFSLAAHALGTRLKNARTRRLLPWSVTVVLGAAALGNWVHASHYSFYLPPGINANLIRTALWLSLAAIFAFYTSLLHTVNHRAYGGKSLLLLFTVVAGSIYVVVERRASFQPPASPGIQATSGLSGSAAIGSLDSAPTVAGAASIAGVAAISGAARPHLLVVGLEGATLDVLLPLARQGRLPFFATLFDSGSYSRLESFPPVRPLALWASLATGKLPFRHALAGPTLLDAPWLAPPAELRLLPLGFFALDLDRLLGTHRPARRADREGHTVWEILGRLGRTTAVLGAQEPLLSVLPSGAEASSEFFRGAPGAAPAFPVSFAGRLELLRGAAAGGDPASAQDRWRLAVATSLLGDADAPEVLFLDLPGLLDVELATLGGFHSAEMAGSRAAVDRRAANTLIDYLGFLDGSLAQLWEKLPEPRFLAVVSAYGVAPPEGLRRAVGEVWRAKRVSGTFAGSPDGALILRGSGIRAGEGLATARIVDLVPTLLYVTHLPIARDFDGRVLTEAFDPAFLQSVPLTFLPSYEDLPAVAAH
ncbi:MAG: alkaline phosphatase family protein [Thermoanaerobaculia bacterium]